ncbi:MAG: hypothetical protein RLZ12_824 [Bacillota bacterium]
MGLTVLFSGQGVFTLMPGETTVIFDSCCASNSYNPNNTKSECNFSMYYFFLSVGNYTPLSADTDDYDPARYLIVLPYYQGRPIALDCSPASGITVTQNNTTTYAISAIFDEIRVFYPIDAAPISDEPKPAGGNYFLSIGVCPS